MSFTIAFLLMDPIVGSIGSFYMKKNLEKTSLLMRSNISGGALILLFPATFGAPSDNNAWVCRCWFVAFLLDSTSIPQQWGEVGDLVGLSRSRPHCSCRRGKSRHRERGRIPARPSLSSQADIHDTRVAMHVRASAHSPALIEPAQNV
ncbi:hypothetical protein B0J12DRAFT_7877 [Macrophomina phaseolina]|uniref:Uncharacterized protein n=1 Tax=Macrophomina phaseolina TaxID=35725 RepID=A0ABQ8GTY8_9PEZI|nr:hypothetical protein B0J12DRAFT_7877 [Macrophomina phaseolina]